MYAGSVGSSALKYHVPVGADPVFVISKRTATRSPGDVVRREITSPLIGTITPSDKARALRLGRPPTPADSAGVFESADDLVCFDKDTGNVVLIEFLTPNKKEPRPDLEITSVYKNTKATTMIITMDTIIKGILEYNKLSRSRAAFFAISNFITHNSASCQVGICPVLWTELQDRKIDKRLCPVVKLRLAIIIDKQARDMYE